MRQSKEFGLSQNADEACVYKKVSESAIMFLELYVDDILIIGNNVSKLQSVNILVIQEFLLERPRRSNLNIMD